MRLDPGRAAALGLSAHSGPVPESAVAAAWDAELGRATSAYEQRMYSFLSDNCHCYVARFLNDVRPFWAYLKH